MKIYPFTKASCSSPSSDQDSYSTRLKALCEAIEHSDYIVIGAGSGLSSAAGLEYGGERYRNNFIDFFNRYHITDMYSAMFYPFATEEERWAYIARHIRMNRFDNEKETALYRQLFEIVRNKDYFVITTNVDGMFRKAGFDEHRVFEVQGDYGYLQCAKGCHQDLYYNEKLIREMDAQTQDCRIPSSLVPRCPVCGGKMEVHIRKDGYFIEGEKWQEDYEHYCSFMQKAYNGDTLLLELGVGYNTPTIIRIPFEQIASQKKNIILARINRDDVDKQADIQAFLPFKENINKIVPDIRLL